MRKYLVGLIVLSLLSGCFPKTKTTTEVNTIIDELINQWHIDAAECNFEAYFEVMADDFYFIGTDASEKWIKKDFKAYCEPHFAKGKAWDFKPIKREIFLNERKDFAWFDEQLDTHMGVCMSSGVLIKTEDGWKIKHYQLSLHVPNEIVQDFKKLMETTKITNTKN